MASVALSDPFDLTQTLDGCSGLRDMANLRGYGKVGPGNPKAMEMKLPRDDYSSELVIFKFRPVSKSPEAGMYLAVGCGNNINR